MAKLVGRLGHPQQLLACFEAGPCGYGLYRQLMALGVACVVVAPSPVPVRPGERVKTDRRDAVKLATLLRSGERTAVYVPDEREEALRDRARAREDAKQDETRARHRLTKFLLRQGVRPPQGVRPWTAKYRKWLDSLHFDRPEHEILFGEYLRALDKAAERVDRPTHAIEQLVEGHPLRRLIGALQALKGFQLVTATTVAVAGDFLRFGHPRQVMSYGGVVPSERSSGGTIRRGAITKTGNAHLRRVIVEAALELPLSAPSQHRPAQTPGPPATEGERHRLEGEGATACAVSSARGSRQTQERGGGCRGSGAAGLCLGHRAGSAQRQGNREAGRLNSGSFQGTHVEAKGGASASGQPPGR